jgi:hypothetical protein
VASLSKEDVLYLRRKGALELPASDICESFIKAYFHYVHAFFPLIEANRFLAHYEQNRGGKQSLLLLWAMFLAASNVRSLFLSAGCPTANSGSLLMKRYSVN